MRYRTAIELSSHFSGEFTNNLVRIVEFTEGFVG